MTWPAPGQRRDAWTRCRGALPLLAILVVAGATYWCMDANNRLEIGSIHNDDSRYAVLATALASGRGYRLINYPEAPLETAYPPAFPALLALVHLGFPATPTALKLTSLFLTLAAVGLAWRELRAHDIQLAFLVAGAFALHPQVVQFSTMVLSEPLFALLILVSLGTTRRYFAGSVSWVLLLRASAAIALAVLTRFVGIALLPAALIYGAVKRQWKHALLLSVVSVALCVPWSLWSYVSGGSFLVSGQEQQWQSGIVELEDGSYTTLGESGLSRFDLMRRNAVSYGLELVPVTVCSLLASPRLHSLVEASALRPVLTLLPLVVIGLILVGALGCRSQAGSLLLPGLFVLIYMSGLLFWPFLQQGRFLYPVLLFLLLYFFRGCREVIGLLSRHTKLHAVPVVLFAAAVLGVVGPNLREDVKRIWLEPVARFTPRLAPAGEWLRDNSSPDAVVLTEYPEWLYLVSARATVDAVEGVGCGPDFAPQPVDYVLVGPAQRWSAEPSPSAYAESCLLPELRRHPQQYELVFSMPANSLWIYAVRH